MTGSPDIAAATKQKHVNLILPSLRRTWARLSVRFWSSETRVMTGMAALVGLGSGLGTVLFCKSVDGISEPASGGSAAPGRGTPVVLLLRALGGLAVGLWMFWLAPKGPGRRL